MFASPGPLEEESQGNWAPNKLCLWKGVHSVVKHSPHLVSAMTSDSTRFFHTSYGWQPPVVAQGGLWVPSHSDLNTEKVSTNSLCSVWPLITPESLRWAMNQMFPTLVFTHFNLSAPNHTFPRRACGTRVHGFKKLSQCREALPWSHQMWACYCQCPLTAQSPRVRAIYSPSQCRVTPRLIKWPLPWASYCIPLSPAFPKTVPEAVNVWGTRYSSFLLHECWFSPSDIWVISTFSFFSLSPWWPWIRVGVWWVFSKELL